MVKVLICDDHEMIRDGLVALIERNSEFSVVASAGDMRGAIAKALITEPDVAVKGVGEADGAVAAAEHRVGGRPHQGRLALHALEPSLPEERRHPLLCMHGCAIALFPCMA